MPLEIRDVDGGLGNIITGSGDLAEDEILAAYEKHFAQDAEKYAKYHYTLADYTNVTKMEISSNAVRRIAELSIQSADINPDPVVAIVANQALIYGMARMWTSFVGNLDWETSVY